MSASIKMMNPVTLKSILSIQQHKIYICSCVRWRSSETKVSLKPRIWQLHSSICLQRYPVITQELTELEARYKNLQNRLETEASLLSDHELQLKKMREQREGGTKASDDANISDEVVTALDLEEEWKKHEATFTPASRITEADKSNNMQTSQRALSKKLILLVQQTYKHSKPVWSLPQLEREDEESMRQTAERALSTCCGDDIDGTVIGNAPCGYYHYHLPTVYGNAGAKVFFFKATYNAGIVAETKHVKDSKWVTREELKDYVSPAYYKAVKRFLIEY